MATVVAVGLGPAGDAHLAPYVRDLLEDATTARLRTRRHPAAAAFPDVESFDALYERAEDFDQLYATIADELVALALADPNSTVVYAVPGSPLIAERTVALLQARDDVDVVVVPAVSFVDLACAALQIDPIDVGLRLGDALSLHGALRGPGPLLLAQTHSAGVLADVALLADDDLRDEPLRAVVLHHLGLPDERVVDVELHELGRFAEADHLTSVYLPELRTAGDATEDLVALMAELRARCPWDRVQSHASLARYLLEESYEALDAIEALGGALEAEATSTTPVDLGPLASHAREELGDVLFQVVFHAHLATEEGLFDLRGIVDAVARKLVDRHPHVFGNARAETPDAVAERWEDIKRAEKGRDSVMDGIPDALPALSLMAKVRRKSLAVGLPVPERASLRASLTSAIDALPAHPAMPDDASIAQDPAATLAIGIALESVCDLARLVGVDPEQALRQRARELSAAVRNHEASRSPSSGGPAR